MSGALWRKALRPFLPRHWRSPVPIPEELWLMVLSKHRFFGRLSGLETERLRTLCGHFLLEKRFSAHPDFVLTDAMALTVAAQACLALLHMGGAGPKALDALDWYGDFEGIVLHPGAVRARRSQVDGAGVVHEYQEDLLGEAMAGGPLMLSWSAVDNADQMGPNHNLVIHEFVHKIDMRHRPDALGAPRLPVQFLGLPPRPAQRLWQTTLQDAYSGFQAELEMSDRFGAEVPWLDPYAAHSPAEFFAVTCEAYFVNPGLFFGHYPQLWRLYQGFYRPLEDPSSWVEPTPD